MFQNQEIYCENCQDKLEDSYQCSNCQSQFCETCIIQQQIILKSCLICQSFDSQYLKTCKLQNLDQNKIISCIYKNQGCQIQIPEKQMNQHIQACSFALIFCKYCGEQFTRQTIAKHKHECCRVCLKCEMQVSNIKQHDCSQILETKLQQLEEIYQNEVKQLKNQMNQQQNKPLKQTQSQFLNKDKLKFANGLQQKFENGHLLIWEKKSIGQHCCQICKSLQLPIRFTCSSMCYFHYCQKCKFPAFIGTVCPRKHTLQLMKKAQKGKQCDVCNEKIQQRKKYYLDDLCDYVICNKCFKEVNTVQQK